MLLLFITTNVNAQELQPVYSVNLNLYAGTWYEIASFPKRFQKNCEYTTANYTITSKGYMLVENRCTKNKKLFYIKGKAFSKKNSGNAKLKVQFLWPFRTKYWIIDLAQDYSYAVVSHPNKKSLWILSRTSTINEEVYQEILSQLKEKGFDINKLKKTKQI
ncbi:hypothetical protein AD998_20425 [bacterium 336/3]|nr:hypothetical protein AD998_20425 [bacterium 336/3]